MQRLFPMFWLFTLSFFGLALPALAAPPAAPSNLVATSTRPTMLTLTWQDNSNDEDGFEIVFRVGNSGAFTRLNLTNPNTIKLDVTGASPQTTYEFKILAYKSIGPELSAQVGIASVTTPAFIAPPALAAPILSGPAPLDQTLSAGAPPLLLPVNGLFSDPDVAAAARLVTDLGNIDFAFYSNAAPLTVANFLNYLNRGDFTNSMFHRSMPGFIIQAGGFRADATASAIATDPPVLNEPMISNTRGTIAMAKQGNNPNSATNQFFINLADNAGNLNSQNNGFTVFARVAGNGMAVADAIGALPRQNYAAINGALTDTPYRIGPATPYNPANLVRILSASTISPLSLTASSSAPEIATASINGENLELVPISPGIATITLTATDLDGLDANTSFSLTVTPDTYEAWALRQNFANGPDSLPTADPDRDSRSNLVEFALATVPLASSQADLLSSIAAGRLTFSFPLRLHTSGISVGLESSETLDGPWTPRWTAQDGISHPWILSAVSSGNFQTITAQNPAPANLSRQFLRLKVTKL